MSRYVAIDTETTGLDPERHEVIEVAAIAFDAEGNILGEYNTLVRPRHVVPYHIERLTGIEAGSVETAPLFSSIATELAEFIADSPIIGQSVEFDLKFLAQGGVWPPGPVYDTFDLGQLLLPGLPSYALRGIADAARNRVSGASPRPGRRRSITRRLPRVPAPPHADARLAAGRARAPRRRGRMVARGLFREAMREAASDGFDLTAGLTTELLARLTKSPNRSTAAEDATVADAEVLALLRRAGGVEGFFQEFEARPEQETMASAVNQASRSNATSSSRRARARASRWPICCRRRCRRCVAASASSSPPTRSACRSS